MVWGRGYGATISYLLAFWTNIRPKHCNKKIIEKSEGCQNIIHHVYWPILHIANAKPELFLMISENELLFIAYYEPLCAA